MVYECDVKQDKSIDNFFKDISNKWSDIDFIVHSVAFSDKDELKGEYVETSRKILSILLMYHAIHLRQFVKEQKIS